MALPADEVTGKLAREAPPRTPRGGLAIAPPAPAHSKLHLADPDHPARRQLDEVVALVEPAIHVMAGGVRKEISPPIFERAVQIMDEAITAGPDDPDLLAAKASVLQAGAQYASANEVYRQILTLDPHHFEARMATEHLATWGETFAFPAWDEDRTELHPVMANLLEAGVRSQLVRDGLQKAVGIVAKVPDMPPDPRTNVTVQWVLSETPSGPLVAYYLRIDPPSEPAFNDEAFMGIAEPTYRPMEGFSLIGQLAFAPYCFVVLVDQGQVTFNRRIVLSDATAVKLGEILGELSPPRSYLAHELNKAAIGWHLANFDMNQLSWDEPAGSDLDPPDLNSPPPPLALAPPPVAPPPVVPPPMAPAPNAESYAAFRPVAPPPVRAPTPPPWAPARERKGRGRKVLLALVAVIALMAAAVAAVGIVGQRQTGLPGVASNIAVPVGLSVVNATTDSVTIGWTYPARGGSIDRFRIYRDGEVLVESVPADRSTFRDLGLAPGTTYRYQVAAEAGGKRSELSPAISVTTDTPGLAAAILDGSYTVRIRLTSESGFTSLSKGERYTEYWSITRKSASTIILNGNSPGGSWTMKLRRSGSVYTGTARESLSKCSFVPVTDRLSLKLRITKARVIDGEWQAARFEGVFKDTAPYTEVALQYCPSSSYTGKVVGTLD